MRLTEIWNGTPQDLTNNLLKQTINDQFQTFLKPYTSFIPAILALLLFFTLQSLMSLINILIYQFITNIIFSVENLMSIYKVAIDLEIPYNKQHGFKRTYFCLPKN